MGKSELYKVIRQTTKNLPCELTEVELKRAGQDLATTVQDIANEEERQTDLKAQMKAKMTELQSRLTQLSIKVSRREEYRDVEVAIELHAEGVIKETRKDTKAIIAVRPARDDEKQLGLLNKEKLEAA